MDAATRRALSTVADVLSRAVRHHRRRDEHDAEISLARITAYSPITYALDDALTTVRGLLDDNASA
jgi:hypothetical protein